MPSPSDLPEIPVEQREVVDPINGGTRTLSNEEAWATDPEFRRKYPATAALRQPLIGEHPDNSIVYSAGRWVNEKMRHGIVPWLKGTTTSPGQGFAGVGIPAALIGALGGAGYGWWRGRGDPYAPSALSTAAKYALLAGLLAGGYGAFRGYNHANSQMSKQSSYFGGADVIAAALARAGISEMERQRLLQQTRGLTDSQKRELAVLIATAGGAGVGSVIARYVAGKNLVATAFGAALGGALTNVIARSITAPTFGIAHNSGSRRDFYGRVY